MAAPPPPPKGSGMSLYANLLNPTASISGAPVLYENGEKDDAATRKDVNSALRFQPIRRPQANQKKVAKPAFPKTIPSSGPGPQGAVESKDTSAPTPRGTPPPPTDNGDGTKPPGGAPPPRSTLADWAATEDDDMYLGSAGGPGEKRQRGGRKAAKKRKKQAERQQQQTTDWDEIYDPARPTNVDEYLRSDERVREVQEWKAVLYAHRRRRRRSARDDSFDESEDESGEDGPARPGVGNQFAPPGDYSFAPPPASPQPRRDSPAATIVPDDATGDDAYARRLALSSIAAAPATHTPPPPLSLPPPPAPDEQPPQEGATISRGPVRYEAPPQPPQAMDIDEEDDEVEDVDFPPALGLGADASTMAAATDAGETRSSRPGQAGFAQRLMSKYGWTAGSGLGASSSGIVNPLSVKVEKRRKAGDGKFAEPGGRGKIIGGTTAPKKKSPSSAIGEEEEEEGGKFGAMSEVIVLRNMLDGMDNLEEEISSGLGQEIGEECGDKYGRVERLYIDVPARRVFIKFTDQVSALRAVNALEGRVFNGNAIAARFWDSERFERGEYS